MNTLRTRLGATTILLVGLLALLALVADAVPALAADAQWTARYWNNRNLSGDPVLRRQENNIDWDWGQGSPDATVVNKDNFSARWTRSVNFPAGTYRFTATMDDGMRVWVNDRLIIDSWIDSQVRSLSADVGLNTGDHAIRVEYYDAGGAAVAKLSWAVIGGPPPGGGGGGGTLLPNPPTANFQGSYFNGTSLSGSPLLTRTDPAINFNWGTGSPASNIPNDRFSVRWQGAVTLDPGRYRFQVLTDDGVRLWVNGRQIIDEWHDARGQTYTGDIDLPGGSTAIQMEYYENVGDARAFLTWGRIDGGGGTGGTAWQGDYFNNRNLSGTPTVVRQDAAINFNWGTGSPASGISPDNFSIRWTQALPLAAGRYRFSATVDDGVRVWVGGQRVIDSWQDGRVRTVTGDVTVPGGNVPVVVEYYEHLDRAEIRVSWQLIGGGGGTVQPPSGQVGTATVLVPRLNVRTGPGTRFERTSVLTQGQTVPLTGFRDATGTWTMINLNNSTAWISALPGYLSTTVPVSSLPVWSSTITGGQPIPSGNLATVGSQIYALNMRTGPDTRFEVITALRNGTVVQLIGRNAAGSWLQVRTADGTVGWVSAPYMVTTTSIPTLPITG